MRRRQLLEEQARNLLEQDGCPPCYPPDPAFSVRNPPEEYRGIISYWDSNPFSDGGALHAQRRDWDNFRRFQETNRRYYKQQFDRFTNAVRERRRRHHLSEDIRLCSNPKEQTRLETWVEFQNYHLHFHEELEKKAKVESQNLQNARENVQRAVDSELKLAVRNEEAYSVRLATAIEKMESHEKHVLPWIEQQRIKMGTALSAIADNTNSNRSAPVPGTRNRKLKVRSVLNPVRSAVSKPDPQKRSLRIQRSELSSRPEDCSANFGTSQSNISQMPNLPGKERPRIRGSKRLRPLGPQKVIKPVKRDKNPKRRANKDTSLPQSPQSRRAEQCKPKQGGRPPRRKPEHQHLTADLVTKSGRISRRPKQPGFISYR